MHKPAGYTSVSPYLIVDGAERTIEFLRVVLEATEIRRFPDPSGKIVHAEVRIDDMAGAVSVQAPVKKDDADKRGGVKDAGGTTWWIATKVE